MSSSSSRPFLLDDTFGAALLGMVMAAILHGVSCAQAFYYFTNQKDTWRLKSLVAAVMVFDTVHQALITHTVYTYTITDWGNPKMLNSLVWSMLVEVLFNGLTAFLVQSFLTYRVWRMSQNNYLLTGVVALLVLAEFVCVIVFTAVSINLETYTRLAGLEALSITVNALAAAGDVLIAGSLCTILHFSRTGFQKSDTMINKLIIFSVNTGLLTSICAVASLISITVAGHTFLYIAFFFCIGRLYTNSLLATLNARRKIRAAASGSGYQSTSENISMAYRSEGGASARSKCTSVVGVGSKRHPANISIMIDTHQEYATDYKDVNLGGREKSSVVPMSESTSDVLRHYDGMEKGSATCVAV